MISVTFFHEYDFRFVATEPDRGLTRIHDLRDDISRAEELLSEKDLHRIQSQSCNNWISFIQPGLIRGGWKVVCRIPSTKTKL